MKRALAILTVYAIALIGIPTIAITFRVGMTVDRCWRSMRSREVACAC